MGRSECNIDRPIVSASPRSPWRIHGNANNHRVVPVDSSRLASRLKDDLAIIAINRESKRPSVRGGVHLV